MIEWCDDERAPFHVLKWDSDIVDEDKDIISINILCQEINKHIYENTVLPIDSFLDSDEYFYNENCDSFDVDEYYENDFEEDEFDDDILQEENEQINSTCLYEHNNKFMYY